MKRIRLTKIAIAANAGFPSAESIEQYRENLHSKYGFSPPVDYWVEGIQIHEGPISIGEPFIMARDNRNGEKCLGMLHTSRVQKVEEMDDYIIIATKNSIYKLENIPDVLS